MKIAFFHNLPAGGAKRVLYEEIKYFKNKKNKIFLFEVENNSNNFLDAKEFADKIFLYNFKIESKLPSFLNRLEKDIKNFLHLNFWHKKIAKDIDSLSPDIVIVHPDKFTQAPFVLKHIKSPKIYYCHELLRIAYEKELAFTKKVFILNKYYENATRKIRKLIDYNNAVSSDILLTNSIYTKNNIKLAYKKNAFVVYPGVDTSVFNSSSTKKSKKILFIGEKSTINGYDLVKKIKNIKFVEFKNKPKISDKDLAKIYSRSYITLCLSINEPFGMVPIESMACKTPVIALNCGGYKETIKKGVGFLIDSKKELIEKINFLYKNKKEYLKIQNNGLKNSKQWSWKKHCLAIDKIIKKYDKKQY